MFFLARDQTDHLSLRFISPHGFGIAVFQFRLRTIEGQHTISTRRQFLRTELSVRGYPYFSEFSAAVRERNAIHMRR